MHKPGSRYVVMASFGSGHCEYISAIQYLYKDAALGRHVIETIPLKDGASQMLCSNSSLLPNAILRSIVNARKSLLLRTIPIKSSNYIFANSASIC